MINLIQISRFACRAALAFAFFVGVAGCASTPQKPEEETVVPSAAKMLAAGDEAIRAGNPEAALALYAQVLRTEPTASTWLKAGLIHSRLGNNREAAYSFEKVIALEPDNVDAHEQLGLVYLALQRLEPARAHLERAIALDATRWRAHNGLGVLADMEHDYAVAIVRYLAALELQPDSAMLLNNLGYSFYLSGDFDKSGVEFVAAVSRDPGYAPARRNLGLLYARKGAYSDAVELLATVMTEAAAYNDVGYMAMLKEDYASAERLLTEAVERSPTYYEIAATNLATVKQRQREGARGAGHSG